MNNTIKICRFQNSRRTFCQIRTVVVLAVLLLSNQIFAAGILDTTFGTGGRVVFRYQPTSNDMVGAAALQPDGKIVLAGKTTYNQNFTILTDLSITRLNPDGSLDTTFGTGGWVLTSFGGASIETNLASAVVILPGGKILAGGAGGVFMALARYNPDGSLDTTFDGDGKVTTAFDGGSGESAEFLLPQADGKVIAAGSMFGNSGGPQRLIILARYNVDGSLDPTFGDGGKYTLSFSGIINNLHGAAIQPDGKILLSGSYVTTRPNCTPTKTNNCSETRHFLNRYDQQMRQDKKFGWHGKILNSRDYFTDLSITPDGRILVGGKPRARRYGFSGWVETLYEPIPRPPNTFSIDGAFQLKQRPNGTVAGCDYGGLGGDFAVALFGADGRYIGSDERDFAGTNDACWFTLIQADGKILAVGRSSQQGSLMSFAVTRYLDIIP
ncbi:MAG TPA: delta-60 repeat domain-containing protein [Pyrinomonadaceae bacterium]